MISGDEFKNGMRRLAGGVSIITASGKNGWRGLTATAVTSLSSDPPCLLVCINNRLEAAQTIMDTGVFGVNVLRYEDEGLAEHFAGMTGVTGPDKFKTGQWQETALGLPMLTDNLVGFECRLLEKIHSGTHIIFIGNVEQICFGDQGRPLVYSDGQFDTLAAMASSA